MSRVSFWMQCIREPNEETLTAMKEAKENGNLETLDLIFMIFSDTNDANK